ncbi:hypothetical protein V427_0082 (plasmid) [Acinetobacter baumannii UH10707]|nr:hypothetical protein C7R87_4040 [Acinetobacter baumannii]ETR59172.1 hypothetical protein V427_0082 [Acinetobacter baumannii UH10707]
MSTAYVDRINCSWSDRAHLFDAQSHEVIRQKALSIQGYYLVIF